jgi:hypothetical protein
MLDDNLMVSGVDSIDPERSARVCNRRGGRSVVCLRTILAAAAPASLGSSNTPDTEAVAAS